MNKKSIYLSAFLSFVGSGIFLFLLLPTFLLAEGSKDFINYEGYRLFYAGNAPQQVKVYAAAGEYINVGASHVGITGGELRVYRPDGTLARTYDGQGDTQGIAIIFDDVQEKNGPTGGGATMAGGYIPGVIAVGDGEAGVWTIIMDFPNPTEFTFLNLLNDQPWTRRQNQPSIQRAITAWDVTVSRGSAGNQGGELLTGRVFSNRYESVISRNGNTTSPNFLVLTRDGYLYELDFRDIDPWNFPLISNNLGIVRGDGMPVYASLSVDDFRISEQIDSWSVDSSYLYTPQARDRQQFSNNKIFFNTPDPTMPAVAQTTNIFSGNTFDTWLYNAPQSMDVRVTQVIFTGQQVENINCPVLDTTYVAALQFEVASRGIVELQLDLDNNGQFTDDVDIVVSQYTSALQDTIYWDGLDGLGNVVSITDDFVLSYRLTLRNGEMHVLMQDVENDLGGVRFQLLNGAGTEADSSFYYDHAQIGGAVSGGGTPGMPLSTTVPFTYSDNFGNDRMLDYWAYVQLRSEGQAIYDFTVFNTCGPVELTDTDGDGIDDAIDLDDDNDGISDVSEYCQSTLLESCFSTRIDPSGDEDEDGIPNYLDADDTSTGLSCIDSNADGQCDVLPSMIDTDGDGYPNHLDLDSDNDAILDVIEAGHFAPDTDGNGIIDGEPVVFGANGWFNSLASDPDATDAEANYQLRDKDRDNYPDIHDLDSDNDGIHDIAEANRGDLDANDNGRIDFLNIGSLGLAAAIDPQQTGIPVPLPSNTDGDSYADYLDLDSDNDGLNDVTEGGGIDLDDDGILGSGAVSVDDNGRVFSDFIGIALVTTSFPLHSDRDMLPDYLDLDSDNDGINDVAEILKEDPDEDGRIGTGAVRVNINGQAFDNEVLTTSIAFDFDIDMLPNYRDLDSDNDGINDVEEATIFTLDFDNNGRVTAGTPETNVLGQPVELDSVLTTSIPIDSDGDGVADYLDLDVDNDGILDTREADFPDADADGRVGEGTVLVNDNGQVILTADASTIATSNPIDWDIDGVRDYRDLDSDNDGIHDVEETRQPDPDNDGRVGTSDLGTDTNGRVQSAEEQNVLLTTTMLKDTDSDAVMDWRDLDSDNDGINDVEEAGLHDPDDDGFVGEGITLVNRYGQAVEAENENVFATTSQPNDNDSDGIPDYNDLDTDNDGINDVAEAGHSDPDNDGFINENIPAVNTYGQAIINPFLVTAIGNSTPPDTDGDGQRDYRDLDSDNDGISDVVEGNNLDPDDNNLVGTGSPDVNNLGQPTGTDAIPANNTSDPIDTDQDGIPDFRDLDSDEDGLTDSDECPDDNTCRDGDADGQFDYRDRDRDNDGIDDNWECANGGTNGTCPDTDGDGIPDVDDLDTDNDGIPDEEECANNGPCPDIDGDGIPEWQDTNCNADALPVLSPTAVAAFCAGDILVLSATNSNPQGDRLTYRWTSPDGTVFTAEDDANGNFMLTVVDAQPSNTGIYTLQVFAEDGCPSERVEVEVTVYPQPEQPVLSVASAEVCLGQEILLSTDDAGDDISYAWYRIRMTDTVLVDMTTEPFLSLAAKLENSGVYYVQTATPTSACLSDLSATQTVTVVELAELEVGNSTSLQQSACEGDAFRLTATNYENATYQWTGPDGFTSDEREPLIENATGEQAGIYALTVTVETCDVVFSGQTTVYVTRNIQPELINLSGQVCEGERIELVVDNSLLILEGSRIRFEWYNDADEQVAVTNSPFLRLENITVEQSGSIYLLVYVNDCVFTASAPIAIEVIASDSEMAEVNQSTYTICGDEEVNLEAVAPQDVNTTGRWETDSPIASIMDANSPTTTVFDLPEGVTTFTWVLTNERCGTSSEASVTVTKEIAVEVKDDSTQIDMNQIAQIDLLENDKLGNALYTFGILDQPQRGTVELMDGIATYTPAENYFGMDNFTYQICNERCPEVCTVATVKIEIIFTQFGDDRCFLPNTITPNRDGKNDAFVVPCLERDFTNNRIAIFNRWGDEVFATEQYRNDWEGTHQGKNLPPGTYFYILQLDRNSSESIQGYFTLVR